MVMSVSFKAMPKILWAWMPFPGSPRALAKGHGISIVVMTSIDMELVKQLAFVAFQLLEKLGLAALAVVFFHLNNLPLSLFNYLKSLNSSLTLLVLRYLSFT